MRQLDHDARSTLGVIDAEDPKRNTGRRRRCSRWVHHPATSICEPCGVTVAGLLLAFVGFVLLINGACIVVLAHAAVLDARDRRRFRHHVRSDIRWLAAACEEPSVPPSNPARSPDLSVTE